MEALGLPEVTIRVPARAAPARVLGTGTTPGQGARIHPWHYRTDEAPSGPNGRNGCWGDSTRHEGGYRHRLPSNRHGDRVNSTRTVVRILAPSGMPRVIDCNKTARIPAVQTVDRKGVCHGAQHDENSPDAAHPGFSSVLGTPAAAQVTPELSVLSATLIAKGAAVEVTMSATCEAGLVAQVGVDLAQRTGRSLSRAGGALGFDCTGVPQTIYHRDRQPALQDRHGVGGDPADSLLLGRPLCAHRTE